MNSCRNIWNSNYTISYFLLSNMTIYFYMLSWNIGLKAMRIVAWLSQCILIETFTTNSNSSSKCLIHISSHDVCAMALFFIIISNQRNNIKENRKEQYKLFMMMNTRKTKNKQQRERNWDAILREHKNSERDEQSIKP